MTTVEFDEERRETQFQNQLILNSRKIPWIFSLLMKMGIVKTEDGARSLILGISVIFLVIGTYLISKYGFGIDFLSHKPSKEEIDSAFAVFKH